MVVELPLDVAEAGSLSSPAAPVAGPAPVAATAAAEREVVVAHPGGEEVQDEGLHVRQVGGVAAELLHVPTHLRRVSPLLGEILPYVHLSFRDLQRCLNINVKPTSKQGGTIVRNVSAQNKTTIVVTNRRAFLYPNVFHILQLVVVVHIIPEELHH